MDTARVMRRFSRRGRTRVFWYASETLSLATLEASGVELTANIQSVTGFDRKENMQWVTGVGSYIQEGRWRNGGFTLYDEKGGDTLRATWTPGTGSYGFVYFIRDADGDGDGGTTGRMTRFPVSTLGPVDDWGKNRVAVYSIDFAILDEVAENLTVAA